MTEKPTYEELEKRIQELEQTESNRKQTEEIKKVLLTISNAVNITRNLKNLFEIIHNALGNIIDVTNFFIAMVDIKKRTLYFPYHVETNDYDFFSITNFDTNNSLTGLVVSQRRPVLLKKNDLEKLSSQKGIWGPVPLIWMGAPLIVKDEIIGVVAVQSYLNSNLYDEQDLQVLSGVSDQIAIAIDREQTEALLKESEEYLANIINTIGDPVFVKDEQFRLVLVNDALCTFLGKTRDELVGTSGMEFLPKDQMDHFLEVDRKVLSSGEDQLNEEPLTDGNNTIRAIFTKKTRYIDAQGAKFIVGVIRDITEGKRAEEKLNDSEARFRDISKSMDEWIWEVDAQGICTFLSGRIRYILGYSAKEVLGKTFFDFMLTEEAQRVAGIFSEITKKKSRIHDLENWNLTKDGRLLCMLTTGMPILDEDGELIGYRGVSLNITDRKQAEKEIKQRTKELKRLNDHLVLSEENERKNLASELHDSVAQSLAMAISQIKNIKEADSGYGIETLPTVQKNIENAIKEVRILIHKLHPQILENFSIDIVLGYLIETVNEKKQLGINYINNLTEPINLIETTKLTIYRAINELLTNIVKHSGSPVAEIELSKINSNIQIRVEDKGKGFELNTHQQKNYCGFGLYSLSERIKNMNGELIINSSLGKGTKVILTVPVNV